MCQRVSRFGLYQARVVTWIGGLGLTMVSARQSALNASTMALT